MKKENKKNSPNRLKCQISGKERMSNKTYIANGIDIEFYTEWNMILESKLRKVRNEVYSKLLK